MNVAKIYRAWLAGCVCDPATVTRIAQFAVTTGDVTLLKLLIDRERWVLTGPLLDQLISRNQPAAIAVFCTATGDLAPQILTWIRTADPADLEAVFAPALTHDRWHPKTTTALFQRREPSLKLIALLNSDRYGRTPAAVLQRRARWFVDGWPWHGRLGRADRDVLELFAGRYAADLILDVITDPVLAIQLTSTKAAGDRSYFVREVDEIVTAWIEAHSESIAEDTATVIATWLLTTVAGRARYRSAHLEPVARQFLTATVALSPAPYTPLTNLRHCVEHLDDARRAAFDLLDSAAVKPDTFVTPDVIADPNAAPWVVELARETTLSVDQAVAIFTTDGAPPGAPAAVLATARDDGWLGKLADALLAADPKDIAYRAAVASMSASGRADWVVAHSRQAGNIRRALRDGLIDAAVLRRLPMSLLDETVWADQQIIQATWELVTETLGANDDAWAVLENVEPHAEATLDEFLEVATAVAVAR